MVAPSSELLMAQQSHNSRNTDYLLNFGLILHFSQTPDNKDVDNGRRAKKPLFVALLIGKAAFLCMVASVPVVTNAGFMQFVTKIFIPTSAEADVVFSPDNSQTMNLLEAPSGTSSKGKADVTISYNALETESGPLGVSADIEDKHSTQISTYVVKEGDTISNIANMFDVSSNTILWSNNLQKGVKLKAGMTLVILPISGVKHTVVKGDTIKSIAKKYGGDTEEIVDYNSLESNAVLALGEVIIVPDGEIAAPVAKPVTTRSAIGSVLKKIAGFFSRPADGPKTQGVHGHNGIDIGGPVGASVYASAAGKVIISKSSGWNGGYGSYVVISHSNGTQTLYAHLSKNNVSEGESVNSGQTIGLIGQTGKSTGPHLHFEVRGATNPF